MFDPRHHEFQQRTGSVQSLRYQRSLDKAAFLFRHLVLAQGHAQIRTGIAVGMTLALGPGKDRLEYHNDLHRYAGVVQALSTS